MELVAVTTCVNYSDILYHMIFQNARFFKIWYIITSPEDKLTEYLIKCVNIPHIKILTYTEFYKNSKFNFGGSRLFAQNYIDQHHTNSNILFLDADIFLLNDFKEKLPSKLEQNTLYGITERLDYWTLPEFENEINAHRYEHEASFTGFFQLYKQNKFYRYKNSYNCSQCDNEFRDTFKNKINLNISVKHLGMEGVNWNGRNLK